ncbi:Clan CA, family C1, cathepsin L-like cysteine peptidase [Trichomonas vaginalis G3]|uniref:Clan CA, family C1, cathepsin L-like cysteine peptidase n=1 Tax=Trichomonas vaginalis (strain ATCC PRA-98 / G3) TaxID=412133 RepID=A2DU12_TRIV3|nr:cysteine-type peptidase protein [Trichomonas vaginalis G3]EAY16159.1 Clan CA, family C1, cathepsin L-like cysteine peptidase [Trichomonas vaginalis G3]KAI5510407.1 cysteine-type peptidase protein [Trichomonas vaginalis G3]|eukprot:XP_001328382.1 Clan CA, family C1, cathepsin L-like cysteine peptidase [Trichomonas vaginalis G3]
MLVQQHEQKAFLSWMRETGNMFTGDEYQTRLGIWIANKRLVQERNRANLGFTVALNRLAHLTPAEYQALLGYCNNGVSVKAVKSNAVCIDEIDWRSKGVVNPVQDQGQCGSCWAFSAIQAQESQYAITYSNLQKLSEQNLVDCVSTCYGCNGGLMTSAYDYVINHQNGKFMLEKDYSYTAAEGSCKFEATKAVSKITSYIPVAEGDEKDLAVKIATYGPAAVAIDASAWSFQVYSSGIYDEPSCSSYNLDHGVGCVGFGKEGSKNYWIVRNSWGEYWGEKGYIRMIKDKNNQCGIATMACIPVDK